MCKQGSSIDDDDDDDDDVCIPIEYTITSRVRKNTNTRARAEVILNEFNSRQKLIGETIKKPMISHTYRRREGR